MKTETACAEACGRNGNEHCLAYQFAHDGKFWKCYLYYPSNWVKSPPRVDATMQTAPAVIEGGRWCHRVERSKQRRSDHKLRFVFDNGEFDAVGLVGADAMLQPAATTVETKFLMRACPTGGSDLPAVNSARDKAGISDLGCVGACGKQDMLRNLNEDLEGMTDKLLHVADIKSKLGCAVSFTSQYVISSSATFVARRGRIRRCVLLHRCALCVQWVRWMQCACTRSQRQENNHTPPCCAFVWLLRYEDCVPPDVDLLGDLDAGYYYRTDWTGAPGRSGPANTPSPLADKLGHVFIFTCLRAPDTGGS